MTAAERLLSTIELARRLNCGRDRIGELVRARRIPYVMVGCLRRFDYDEVVKCLRVEAEPPRPVDGSQGRQ